MGNLGFQELLVIAVVALLVFGPDRLPELARQAGKAVSRFRQETSRSIGELKRAAELEELERELKHMREELREVGQGLTAEPSPRQPTPAGPRRALTAPPPTDPDAT
jgi:sec-independent protein translocase protein TatB